MNKLKTVLGLMLACALAPTGVYADDTEIFFAKANADNSENKPKANVLFLIDTTIKSNRPPSITKCRVRRYGSYYVILFSCVLQRPNGRCRRPWTEIVLATVGAVGAKDGAVQRLVPPPDRGAFSRHLRFGGQ